MDPVTATDPIVYLVQVVVSLLFALVPPQHRHVVETGVLALLAAQVVASVVVSRLPVSAMQHPRWGRIVKAMHRFGHMRFRDELGTLKAPGAPPLGVIHAETLRRIEARVTAAADHAVTVNTETPAAPATAPAVVPAPTSATASTDNTSSASEPTP